MKMIKIICPLILSAVLILPQTALAEGPFACTSRCGREWSECKREKLEAWIACMRANNHDASKCRSEHWDWLPGCDYEYLDCILDCWII